MAGNIDFEFQTSDGPKREFHLSGKKAAIAILSVLLLFVGGCWSLSRIGSVIVWSEGYRDGHVIKFSHRGFPVKHWEGDLNMGALGRNNASVSDNSMIWHFSVNDDAIVKDLEAVNSEIPVRLHYKEYMGQGMWNDTKYFVTKVERLDHRR